MALHLTVTVKNCSLYIVLVILLLYTRCLVRLYLQLFVGGCMSYLRYLCLFACGGVQHISCCVFTSPLHQMGGGGGCGILFYLCPSFYPSHIFFVAFFSATIDGRNLIFGHKFYIGMPYCGKRFSIRQIPTSCLPT